MHPALFCLLYLSQHGKFSQLLYSGDYLFDNEIDFLFGIKSADGKADYAMSHQVI